MAVDKKSESTDKKVDKLIKKSALIDKKAKQLIEKSALIDEKADQLIEKSRTIDWSVNHLMENSESIDESVNQLMENSNSIDEKTNQLMKKIESIDERIEEKIVSQPLPRFSILVAILMAIIAFLAIVVGIYGEIFDRFIREDQSSNVPLLSCVNPWINPKKYIDFFEEQRKISDTAHIDTTINLKKINEHINHIFIVDITM
jgi:hypothetical protein